MPILTCLGPEQLLKIGLGNKFSIFSNKLRFWHGVASVLSESWPWAPRYGPPQVTTLCSHTHTLKTQLIRRKYSLFNRRHNNVPSQNMTCFLFHQILPNKTVLGTSLKKGKPSHMTCPGILCSASEIPKSRVSTPGEARCLRRLRNFLQPTIEYTSVSVC